MTMESRLQNASSPICLSVLGRIIEVGLVLMLYQWQNAPSSILVTFFELIISGMIISLGQGLYEQPEIPTPSG